MVERPRSEKPDQKDIQESDGVLKTQKAVRICWSKRSKGTHTVRLATAAILLKQRHRRSTRGAFILNQNSLMDSQRQNKQSLLP